jgi:hypothetical protein
MVRPAQGLKPSFLLVFGTTEVVPCYKASDSLVSEEKNGAAERAAAPGDHTAT